MPQEYPIATGSTGEKAGTLETGSTSAYEVEHVLKWLRHSSDLYSETLIRDGQSPNSSITAKPLFDDIPGGFSVSHPDPRRVLEADEDMVAITVTSIERAAMILENAAVERGKTVALLSAGRDRIDRIQSQIRALLDQLLEAQ